jgi:CheY-like chemotaxis protein
MFCLMKTMTRRKFLKAGFGLAAVASGLEMITGCATTETPKAVTTIVAVTSYAMPGDREKAMAAGCSGYIEKPIDPDTFDKQVEKYLSMKHHAMREP